MSEQYLGAITLSQTRPCLAYPGRLIVVGRPDRPLDEVLPYLAALPGVIAYQPAAGTLTFRRQPGFLTLYRDKVYITQVAGVAEGLQLLAALTDAINATWDNRAALATVTTARRAPRPLDVYTLLPHTNCRRCGEATCMAFAFGLLQHQRTLDECPVLQTEAAFAERRAALAALL